MSGVMNKNKKTKKENGKTRNNKIVFNAKTCCLTTLFIVVC